MKTMKQTLDRIRELVSEGKAQKKIAEILNAEGYRTTTGGEFTQVGVSYYVRRRLHKRMRPKFKKLGRDVPTARPESLEMQELEKFIILRDKQADRIWADKSTSRYEKLILLNSLFGIGKFSHIPKIMSR